jgi:hypothetical protein
MSILMSIPNGIKITTEENNPDFPEMFSTFAIGIVIAIVFVVLGLLLIVLARKG